MMTIPSDLKEIDRGMQSEVPSRSEIVIDIA